jgi:hypothetical protein
MTESELLSEEIAELEAEIRRLKGSMNRADNGVKLHRLRVATRTLERLKALAKREAAA